MLSGMLFPLPSILSGVARLLDLGAQLDEYNISATPREADVRAMYSDWRAIGEDLHEAMEMQRP
jgi:hypothetical protein